MRCWTESLRVAGCAAWLIGLAGCSTPTLPHVEANAREAPAPLRQVVARQAPAGVKDAAPALPVPPAVRDATKKDEDVPFRLPEDAAGRLLGQVLPPRPLPLLVDPATPAATPAAAQHLTEPTALLPAPGLELGRLPRPPRPRGPQPEFQLAESLESVSLTPVVPQVPGFVPGNRVRVASEHVAIPPELPVLGTAVPDRVTTDDATGEASTAAVLAAPLPYRSTPAPYARLTVPQPYEHRQAIAPVASPGEEPTSETAPRLPAPSLPGKP